MEKKNKKNSVDININLSKDKDDEDNVKQDKDNKPVESKDNLSSNNNTVETKGDKDIDNSNEKHQEEDVMDTKKETVVSRNSKSDVMAQQLTKLTTRLDNLESENKKLKEQVIVKDSQIKELQDSSERLQSEITKSSYQVFKEKHLNEGNITESQLMRDDSEGIEKLEKLFQSLDETQRGLFDEFVTLSPLKTALSLAEKRATSQDNEERVEKALPKADWIDRRIENLIKTHAENNNLTFMDVTNNDDLYYSFQNQAYREWEARLSSAY
jgi:hypothetical protein